MTNPIDNIKPFLWTAGALVSLGIGWSELNARIAQKAESEKVREIEQRLEAHLERSAQEWRVNRVLLCRMPEIRPDSYCEGYR